LHLLSDQAPVRFFAERGLSRARSLAELAGDPVLSRRPPSLRGCAERGIQFRTSTGNYLPGEMPFRPACRGQSTDRLGRFRADVVARMQVPSFQGVDARLEPLMPGDMTTSVLSSII
jgi:hypothetical protein